MAGAATERLLPRLDGVRGTNGSWQALCPAHADSSPSLSIKQGDKGAMVHCHSNKGCDTEAITKAVGLTTAMLFDDWTGTAPPAVHRPARRFDPTPKAPAKPKQAPVLVATYDYTDAHGTLEYQVRRYEPKTFRQRRPDPTNPGQWISNLQGVTRYPYRYPELVAAIDNGETVHVVEGEKDADRLHSLGETATCNSGGAKAADTVDWATVLEDAHVVIVADKDEPGRHWAVTIRESIQSTAASCVVVEARYGKDTSDHLDHPDGNTANFDDQLDYELNDADNEPADAGNSATSNGLNLPAEFWDARPWLQQIRDGAFQRLASPDAVLGSFLARYAAAVPATIKLPAIIGSAATFDFITCVVAMSSGGKTISNGVAKDLFPSDQHRWVMFDAPTGSGEGLVQAFMGWEKDEKGKKVGDPSFRHGKHKSVHFTADEGTAILEAQSRSGTTLVQTLCSAWSGATLGQLNASQETNRLVPGGQRRMAAAVNIQTSLAAGLFDSALIGLPKRMVFFWAHAELPDPLPAWPGIVDVKVPDGWGHLADTFLTVDDEIRQELHAARRSVAEGAEQLGDLDGHAGLLQLKTAGLFALADGRFNIDTDDWNMAGQIMDVSLKVRNYTQAVKREADKASNQAKTVAYAEREAAVDDLKERRAVARLRDAIIRHSVEPVTPGQVRKASTSHSTRHRFDDALALAVEDGAVEIVTGDDGHERIQKL